MGNIQATPPVLASEEHNLLPRKSADDKEYDIFRDSLLRYTGYANEVGEAFRRHVSSKVVFASYAIATAYVCADAAHKALGSIRREEPMPRVFTNTADAFIWQIFASVIIPGFVINRVTYFTRRLVRLKRKKCICSAPPIIRYAPVAVGLLAIPFIIHPIDSSVTWVMDNTVRKWYPCDENSKQTDED